MTLLAVGLLLPVLLLVLMLMMERVERPLRGQDVSDELASFLDSARPDEVETYVSEGFAPALERYWRRRRLTRLLPGRPRPPAGTWNTPAQRQTEREGGT